MLLPGKRPILCAYVGEEDAVHELPEGLAGLVQLIRARPGCTLSEVLRQRQVNDLNKVIAAANALRKAGILRMGNAVPSSANA